MSASAAMPDEFRPDDPATQVDPYPYYPMLRTERPVLRSSLFGQPCWVLSRRADIAKALMDPKTFSSKTTPIPILLFADPPEHAWLRTMIAPEFARTAIQPLAAVIAEQAEALVGKAVAAGGCDLIEDVAMPLTIVMISGLLAISTEHVHKLRELSRLQAGFVLAMRLGVESSPEASAASATVSDFMGAVLDFGEDAPDGVVALLAERLRDGELTPEECISLIVLLFVAGHTTTTNAIGSSVYMLTQRPANLDRRAADKSFISPFLEGAPRTRPSFQRIPHYDARRRNRRVTIPAKSLVILLLGSANRDEGFFAEPERFDPDAERRAHLAFGQGIHSCLGLWRPTGGDHDARPLRAPGGVGQARPGTSARAGGGRHLERVRLRPPAGQARRARAGRHRGLSRFEERRTMKTRAAVAFEARKPLEIVELDLEGPRAGEVLVEIMATGICHTDAYTLDGLDSEGLFPSVLGHEGAGIVREVGAGVTSVAPGDHVIPLYTPECRQCKSCLSGKTNLCTAIRATQGKGLMPDGTTRFSYEGQPIFHYMGCSTFSNFTVLPEIAVAKIRPDAPFKTSCYVGCGVTTGVGAVVNTAKVQVGESVVVFGLGGIGLNVIQGARLAGAATIVGVDINPDREEWGRRFGMTDFLNSKGQSREETIAAVLALTDGGADYSFDATGNTEVMRTALECCHRGWGTSIIIGVAEAGKEIATRPFQLVTGRNWRGTAFGGAKGRTDVPRIVDWYMNGKIEIDPMITHTLTLDEINTGFDLMRQGESIRSVVVY